MSGWIKLHRGLLDWEWYDDANTCRVFIHCLLRANHREKKWKGKTISRGQFISSFDKMAGELGLSRQKIRTAMGNLGSTSEITIESCTQHTVFTVKNYESFQSETSEATNEEPTIQPTIQPTDNHKQEVKNLKNKNIGEQQADAFADVSPPKSIPIPYEAIVNQYHEVLPMMPQVRAMTAARKQALMARWNANENMQTVDSWKRFFGYVATSDFLTGRNEKWDRCNFEWLIKESNFTKVIEGNYAGQ